jgi:hypothetical protein
VAEPVTKMAATYHPDGRIVILTSEDGLPSMTALVPAPMMDESKRQEVVARAKDSAWMSGQFIESERRIRNDVFDKRGEKTTTEMRVRMCKNPEEAAFVMEQITRILRKMEQEAPHV